MKLQDSLESCSFFANRRYAFAISNLILHNPGKDSRMDKAIYRMIGYVDNPDKKGSLITGYACDRIPLLESLLWIKGNISCVQAECADRTMYSYITCVSPLHWVYP